MSAVITIPSSDLSPTTKSTWRELSLVASWLNVLAAANIQAATLPCRVYGLGMITEPLLDDFDISRARFGEINFWATLLTAGLCFSFGPILTRVGTRRTQNVCMVALGAATALLTMVNGMWLLFGAIALARVLGQGMLALVSTSLVAKSFPRRVVLVMAAYSVLTSFMYFALVVFVKVGTNSEGLNYSWRTVWLGLAAIMIIGLAPLNFLTISEPRVPPEIDDTRPKGAAPQLMLGQAMRSPVFILFGLSCLVTGMANSGVALFNESLLEDRGFSRNVFFESLTYGIFGILLFQIVAAVLCERWSMRMMSALCMILYAATSFLVPHLQTESQVYGWSIAKSLALSVHMVIYYSIGSYAFGRLDIARIQGIAHVCTVSASGLGPWIFGVCRDRLGSYDPCMYATAAAALAIGIAMLFFPVPCAERPKEATVG
jgi:cyanate permease